MNTYKYFFLFTLLHILSFPITAQKNAEPQLLNSTIDASACRNWVDSVYNTMSLEEQIGQLFMMVVKPDGATSSEQTITRYVENYHVGGLYFSAGSVIDHAEATNRAQAASKIPLLIGLDGEWGLAMRLSDTPQFPRNMMLGALQNDSLIYEYGKEIGRECRRMGIHINFAPVCDVNNNPENPVIGNRSFGEDPQTVTQKALAYMKGLQSQQIIAVAKHFPGHGDTKVDSHEGLPVITHSRERLDQCELYPFKQMIDAGIDGIMTGHLAVPALDPTPQQPASLSSAIINDLLKKELHFKGLTFTDALIMKGASANKQLCIRALKAGNDILLSPNRPDREIESIKNAIKSAQLSRELIEEKVIKILTYKYIAGLSQYHPIKIDSLIAHLNRPAANNLNALIHLQSITLLKNQQEYLPIRQLATRPIASLALGASYNTAFQEHLSLYCDMPLFTLPRNAGSDEIRETNNRLSDYPQLIVSIHSPKLKESEWLKTLCKTHEVTLVFFTPPYRLADFKESIKQAKAVLVGYEPTDLAEQAAAEGVFGGISIQGKLPVTLDGLFEKGAGITTQRNRISYLTPSPDVNYTRLDEKITQIVREGLDEKAYPGCQVMVIKGGNVIFNRSFGYTAYESNEPVRNNMLYDLASLTKTTATLPAVMKLYDEKRLRLEDKLSHFIPKSKGTDKASITLSDMLYHQSGLVSFVPFYRALIDDNSYDGPLFKSSYSDVYSLPFDGNTYANSLFRFKKEWVADSASADYPLEMAKGIYLHKNFKENIIQQIIDSPLRSKGKYVYSDLNFILLKEVVELLTRTPFDEYVRQTIFLPLGANLIGYQPLKRIDLNRIVPTANDQFLRKQLLRGYPHDEAAAVSGGVAGNAGLFSNANDIAKYLQMLLNKGNYGGENILSQETVNLFTKSKSKVSRRGLGFDKSNGNNPDRSPVCEAASVTSDVYGHTGFTGTCYWVDPHNQLIYIFLSNRIHPDRDNPLLSSLSIRWRIHEAIYESFDNHTN